MKQYEAVIEVMKANGGYATLGFLNARVLKVPGPKWKTKTPAASIRRIVQDERFFFKIRPGLWALKEYRDRIPFAPALKAKDSSREFTHAYYQGLLVEIGNLKSYETFVPAQDKNKKYLEARLGEVTTVREYPPFSYKRFTRCARTIDVTWFNDRKMPASFFEVEHTTSMRGSLVKFVELQDFASRLVIVADGSRKREFADRLAYAAFKPVAGSIKFWDYETVGQLHARTFELASLENSLGEF